MRAAGAASMSNPAWTIEISHSRTGIDLLRGTEGRIFLVPVSLGTGTRHKIVCTWRD